MMIGTVQIWRIPLLPLDFFLTTESHALVSANLGFLGATLTTSFYTPFVKEPIHHPTNKSLGIFLPIDSEKISHRKGPPEIWKASWGNPCTIWCIPSQASRPPQSRPSGFFINVWLRYIPIPSMGLVQFTYMNGWIFMINVGKYTINHKWMLWDRYLGELQYFTTNQTFERTSFWVLFG